MADPNDYSRYFSNAQDVQRRRQAEEELILRAHRQAQDEAERRKIEEAHADRFQLSGSGRPRPAPGRKMSSPQNSAAARHGIRKSSKATPRPSDPQPAQRTETSELYESFMRARAQRGGRARFTEKDLNLASNYGTRTGQGNWNGPSRPQQRTYRRPSPPAPAAKTYRPSKFVEELSSDSDDDEEMPPPTSARSPLYNNVSRTDTRPAAAATAPRKNGLFSLNPPTPRSPGGGLFGSKSPTRPTTSYGEGLFTSSYRAPLAEPAAPSAKQWTPPQQEYHEEVDFSGLDEETIEAILMNSRAKRRDALGGNGRARFGIPCFPSQGKKKNAMTRPMPNPNYGFEDVDEDHYARPIGPGAASYGIQRRNAIRRPGANTGAFGVAGQSHLARSNATRQPHVNSGTQGRAGVSGVLRNNARYEPSTNAGMFGTAGVSGVQRRNRVDPRPSGGRYGFVQRPAGATHQAPRNQGERAGGGFGTVWDGKGRRRSARNLSGK